MNGQQPGEESQLGRFSSFSRVNEINGALFDLDQSFVPENRTALRIKVSLAVPMIWARSWRIMEIATDWPSSSWYLASQMQASATRFRTE